MGRVKEVAYAWPNPIDLTADVCLPDASNIFGQPQQQQQQKQSYTNGVSCFTLPNQTNLLASSSQDSGLNGCHALSPQQTTIQSPVTAQTVRMVGHSNASTQQPIQTIPLSQPTTAYYPLVPLSSGGFIFNYPPLYSAQPIHPFSHPIALAPAQINNTTPNGSPAANINGSPMFPSSPIMSTPSSPSSSSSSCPPSPFATPEFAMELAAAAATGLPARREKLDKYRHKRTKRNWNRSVDLARRERAQARNRDEFGHFVSGSLKKTDLDKERMMLEFRDVKTKLQEIQKESQELKSKLNAVQQELQEQSKINNQLMSENRILWSSVPADQIFNTVKPNAASYVDAFKEKIDFSSIELNLTQSPFFDEIRLSDDFDKTKWVVDYDNSSGSFS